MKVWCISCLWSKHRLVLVPEVAIARRQTTRPESSARVWTEMYGCRSKESMAANYVQSGCQTSEYVVWSYRKRMDVRAPIA